MMKDIEAIKNTSGKFVEYFIVTTGSMDKFVGYRYKDDKKFLLCYELRLLKKID